MKKILFLMCVALAVYGCSGLIAGDNGDLPYLGSYYSSSSWLSSSSIIYSSSSSLPSSSSSAVSSYTPANYINPYKTVDINGQVWLAENLNYEVAGSKCYDNDPSNCDKYGRLYDWATAMGFDSRCNSNNCSSLIQTKHQGICPNGWHIPSDNDWDILMTSVGGSSTAGKHLKAQSGWYSCGPSGSGSSYSCEDTYGFAALPDGLGYSEGNFTIVGRSGYWWSAPEYYAINAYGRYMNDYNEDVSRDISLKTLLFSVRCVRD